MSNERILIDYINNVYKNLPIEFTPEQKMIFETGVAQGITFALTKLINVNIDLSVLGKYTPDEALTNLENDVQYG